MDRFNKYKGGLVALLFALMVSNVFAGGPWTQKKGEGYFKLSEWWMVFDQHFTDAGELDPNVTTGIFNTFVYAEYGFHDRVTGIVNAAVFSRNYMNNLRSETTREVIVPGDAVNYFGDVDLAVKYRVNKLSSPWPVAVSLTLGIPTGKSVAGDQNNLQTGDGEFNQLLQVDAGRGFRLGKKTSAYASTYLGFNHRTNGFSEGIRYGVEFGAGLAKNRLWLIGRITGIESLKNGATADEVTSTSIFANNTEFTSIGAEVAYYVKNRWGVSASATGAFRGEIIAAAPSYSVGVFYDMSRK